MGAIARAAANNITTSGVFTSNAITNSSVTGITVLANVAEDGVTFISSQTANNSASLSFTAGIDSTYKAYKFVFSSIKPRGSNVYFTFQGDISTNTNYNQTITSTTFYSYNAESDGGAVQYVTSTDQAQGTAFQYLNFGSLANDADTSLSGTLQLFNPSSTTYVKHFISNTNAMLGGPYSSNGFGAGYFNTTSAITRIQFKMSSGNFDGTIYLYGIK
jgi:hypothetical protein